ncbi:DinB family protein [Mesobacterium sp. TK19101]|uniref:DinB family protein n=1 Tax=Mesobacterium hydrothermale TaxID=3111907 RepID=A0ABU6HCK5_9RHOB|nr:DinB family protein [Mesobacterium sp. TK19101]MEC3860194.1 DinB family protein [Mesobacterium sp. TK19101]
MIVTPDYCVTMARYNAWQNRQLRRIVEAMPDDAVRAERGAFFGSILATLNHILWGDRLWMAMFTGSEKPDVGIPGSVELTPSVPEWATQRFRVDGQLLIWAETLSALDLTGSLTWYSGAMGQEVTRPVSVCVMHMFNHQTHHRGQVHAMLTAAGQKAPATDLVFMPADGPWP